MDSLLRFLFDEYRVRGQIVRLERSWAEVASRQRMQFGRDVPPNVRQRLGELTAAGLLLSASLKFDGSLILQIQGQGPIPLFVVEVDVHGNFRSTFKSRADAPLFQDASLKDLVAGEGQARFAVTLVPENDKDADERGAPGRRLKNPYQGIVPFEGDTVAEVLQAYMTRSEQIPTRLWLAADEERAVGLLLQQVPDQEADDADAPSREQRRSAEHAEGWNRVTTLSDTLARDELLSTPIDTLLRRLFWDCPIALVGQASPSFACSCSREKVGSMLQMLGRQEVDSILSEQQQVSVKCEFCFQEYSFGPEACAALFAPAAKPSRG